MSHTDDNTPQAGKPSAACHTQRHCNIHPARLISEAETESCASPRELRSELMQMALDHFHRDA